MRRLSRRRSSRPWPFSHDTWSSGGKSLLGEEAFGAFADATLVAFQPEEIITAPLLRDEARACLLTMHRGGGDERAWAGRQLAEQRLERGDLVAFCGDRQLRQRQAQAVAYGGEQLQRLAVAAAAAAQHLAIHRQAGQHGGVLFAKPAPDDGGEGGRIEVIEHAEERGVAQRGITAVFVLLTAEGFKLARLTKQVTSNHQGGKNLP